MMRLRGGSNCLRIEQGRWKKLPVEERVCQVCMSGEVEDEEHFMLRCGAYSDLRKLMIEELQQLGGEVVSEEGEEREKWMVRMLGSGIKIVSKSKKVEKRHKVAMAYLKQAI